MSTSLVKGHAKTPMFLYIEAGATPIRFLIASRRLMYHQCILKRDDQELIRRIYCEQKRNPTKGDFIELIKEDFKMINEIQDDTKIQMTGTHAYKMNVKNKIKAAALDYLKGLQAKHSKVKDIQYSNLEIQPYIICPNFTNDEVNMLHALRSRSTDCKTNYKQKYLHSNLLCSLCGDENEDQQHLLRCKVLAKHFKGEELTEGAVEYEDIFSQM